MLTSFERNVAADFRRERHDAAVRAANVAFARASRPVTYFGAVRFVRMIGAGARKAVPFLFRSQGLAWRRPRGFSSR